MNWAIIIKKPPTDADAIIPVRNGVSFNPKAGVPLYIIKNSHRFAP